MKPLHNFQARLLEVLREMHETDGYSLEQLRRAIGASSKSQVVHHIYQLERKGLLKRDPDNPNNFIVFGENEAEHSFFFLPLLALASCGGRGIDNAQHVIERIPVSSTLIPGRVSDSYLVQASGDSMEPRIYHGDILIVEKISNNLDPVGKIVLCEEDGEAKIKQYTKCGNNIVLASLNREYPPHVITPSKFHLHGIIRGVLFSKIDSHK